MSIDRTGTEHSDPARWVALGVTALTGVLFVLLAVWLVPWDAAPAGLQPAGDTSVFDRAQLDRGEEYANGARWLSWSSLAVALVVAAGLGFTRLGRSLTGWGRWWPLRVLLAVAALGAIARLVTLPFAWASRQRRLDAGLTNQATPDWLLDLVRSLAVEVVLTALAVVVLVACARRWRRWWPAVVAALGAALVLVGSFLYPVVVEPLFNDFESMPSGELRSEIMALADREGVAVDDVLVADASRRTTTLNAYVSGLGATKRVVVYDNLIASADDDAVLSVVAHELGHARERDVLVGTTLGAVGTAFGVGLLALALCSPALRRRSGSGGAHDPAVVPLVLALVAVGTLVASPVQATISRHLELRADVVALEFTDNPEAFIEMQRLLCLRSLCDPTPPAWSQFWFGTHPTVLERVGLAREY